MPLGDALAEQYKRDEGHQDAVRAGEEGVLAGCRVHQAEGLRGIRRPDDAAHEHAEPQVLAVEVRLNTLMEDNEHDGSRQKEAARKQHERRHGVEHRLHGEKRITPNQGHGDEHELPEQR